MAFLTFPLVRRSKKGNMDSSPSISPTAPFPEYFAILGTGVVATPTRAEPLQDLTEVGLNTSSTIQSSVQNHKAGGKRATILSLPTELHLKIFSHLHCTESVCLGLACKSLYAIHWGLHGEVSLDMWSYRNGFLYESLYRLLGEWIRSQRPDMTVFMKDKFMNEKTYEILMAEDVARKGLVGKD